MRLTGDHIRGKLSGIETSSNSRHGSASAEQSSTPDGVRRRPSRHASQLAGVIRLATWLYLCTVKLQALQADTLGEAWRQWCSLKEHKCMHQVSIPQKAYVISLPTDSEKREHVLPPIQALGLEPEIVDGIMENQLGEGFTKCHGAMTSRDCQAGLTRAHIEAWTRLVDSGESSAWIFEDDVIFHDDLLTLFPQYWKRVPRNFEFIFVGEVYPWGEQPDIAVIAAPRTTPWGTHAYIISAVMAEQLANLGKWMIHRAALVNEDKSAWELDGDDIKIDHFIKNYYDQLLPAEHRQRWMIFGTPKAIPWSFGSVVSSASNGCRCECEDIDDCIMAGRAPIAPSTGLASQHNCGNRIGHLKKWHKGIRDRSKRGHSSNLCNGTAIG